MEQSTLPWVLVVGAWILLGTAVDGGVSGVVRALPVVDKGVFVITGVKTCGAGGGYCILGGDCTVDKEFETDEGHCDGLRKAFTPRAYFACCRVTNQTTSTTTTTTTTVPPLRVTTLGISIESVESVEEKDSPESEEESVQTEISVQQGQTSSCRFTNRNEKLAAGSVFEKGVCWTGAVVAKGLGGVDLGSYICTGGLISYDVLLTTATCASRLTNLNDFNVVFGTRHLLHPRNNGTPMGVYRRIASVVIHEGYSVQKNEKRVNDIALIQLVPGDTSGYCTICLPEEDTRGGGQQCIVSGFSHPTTASSTTAGGSGVSEWSDGVMHEAEQYVLKEWADEGVLSASGKYNEEACFSPRDAGSPLACGKDGEYRLNGLFSTGFHCGSTHSPVTYTNVFTYLDWIQKYL